jgi:hypothetical protein
MNFDLSGILDGIRAQLIEALTSFLAEFLTGLFSGILG